MRDRFWAIALPSLLLACTPSQAQKPMLAEPIFRQAPPAPAPSPVRVVSLVWEQTPKPVDTGERSGLEPDTSVESRAFVRQLLAGLDEDKRNVLVLYEIEGLTMREVAEVVGCPLQTAYSRLHAARDLLQVALERAKAGGT